MDKDITTITIDNFNNKKIVFKMSTDTDISIHRETNLYDILTNNKFLTNVEIDVEGIGITMEVEEYENNR